MAVSWVWLQKGLAERKGDRRGAAQRRPPPWLTGSREERGVQGWNPNRRYEGEDM